MEHRLLDALLLHAFRHRITAPDADTGLALLAAGASTRAAVDEWRKAVSAALHLRLIQDPVLPAGRRAPVPLAAIVDRGRRRGRPALNRNPRKLRMKVFTVIGGCTGKTELVRRLVAGFKARGLNVSTIKRVPDTLDLEKPDSGTWSHRQAGAEEVMLASAARYAILPETPTDDDEPDVDSLLARFADVDLALLERFKLTFYPKLELEQIPFASEHANG